MIRGGFALMISCFVFVACSSNDKSGSKISEKLKPGELPLEMFFRNPVASGIVVSPDGAWLLSRQPLKGRMNVFIKKIADKEWTPVTRVTDRDISSAFWKNNETIIYTKDFGGDENFHVFAVNAKTKEARDLTNFKDTKAEIYETLRHISDTDIIVGMNNRDPKVFDVYRINTVTGASELILQNNQNYMGFTFDNQGNLRIATSTDGVNRTYYYRDIGQKDFKKIITLNFKETLSPMAFDKDNKFVYAVSNLKSNTASAVLMDPRTGKTVKSLFNHPKYDVSGVEYSRARQELIAASYADWKPQDHFFSPYFKAIEEDLQKQIPGKEVSIQSSNLTADLFTVAAMSDRTGPKFYLYDAKTKKLDFLLDSTPWMKEDMLVEMKPVQYKARDGMPIEGYLFLPKNSTGKNLPVVINPHGGPWARDHWGYHAESQFLANRGYAVFKMNFRGSTGFGKKFWMSSFKQWGRKMQDDVTDGVNWLVSQGIADKSRVAIYGASYGGYATLAGLAFTPDLYRCGVDYVGVSNLFTLIETIPPYWKPMQEMFYEMVGHPVREKELVKNASPLFSADKIKAPLFIAQGAKDPRVKKSESDQIVEALKKRGVEVPYLVKDNEGHGFRNEENRFEFYHKMEAFLDQHMTVM